MGVTLQQIAEAAGVSRGTVDRALNDRGRIKPEVAEKIKKIAEEMGYQPNRAGRALAMAKQSVRIGVILQSADTPFMKKVLNGIEDAKAEVPISSSSFETTATSLLQFVTSTIIIMLKYPSTMVCEISRILMLVPA